MSDHPSNPLSERDGRRLLAAALAACRRAGEIELGFFHGDDLAVEKKADGSPVTRADKLAEEAAREILRRAAPELGLLGEEHGAEGSTTDRWVIDPLDGTKNFVAGLPFFAVLIGLELAGELVLGAVHAPAMDRQAGGATWWALRGRGAFRGAGADPEGPARPLRVRSGGAVAEAFIAHGGLVHFQEKGLWPAFGELVAAVGRTRGFGDFWGHMLVAEGRCDAMLEGRVAYHDVAAVSVIVEAAGGVFRTRGNRRLDPRFDEPAISSAPGIADALARLLKL